MVALALMIGCAEDRGPCGLEVRPDTIDDVLELVGALPSPVTLNCVLTSLERPLGLELTSDVFSAQPAMGIRSPRTFLRFDHLTLSVVPDGEASDLLELGEWDGSGLTVKAELQFPIALPLDPAAPFERVLAAPGADATGCSVCHSVELALDGGRYASTPLRPPEETVVGLEVLQGEHERCDRAEEPDRCAMLSALLDHGDVEHDPFPSDYSTL